LSDFDFRNLGVLFFLEFFYHGIKSFLILAILKQITYLSETF